MSESVPLPEPHYTLPFPDDDELAFSARQMREYAAAVSAAKDAEIAALRERLQKLSYTMKGMDAHEASLAEAQAFLMERVRVLEDAIRHYEAALAAAWPQGAMGKSYEHWNAARIARAALEQRP